MNHGMWVIDFVLMFRLVTAKAEAQQGPTILKLDLSSDDLNKIEEAFRKDLRGGIAWIRNPSRRIF
jgi:hypothetical protein